MGNILIMKLNKKSIYSVFIMAAFVQLVIITYNQLTGYIHISSIFNFVIRLLIGTFFSSIYGLVLLYLDLAITRFLDKSARLPEKLLLRIPVELSLSTLTGILVGSTGTILVGTILPYDDGLLKNVINNSLITSVINLILIVIIEAINWFKRSQASLVKSEKLERENSIIKFETLKDQLNPHFLFNSLNVLSSLVKRDSDKAQKFIDEFSSVYRYTLDVIDRPVVDLGEELEFAKSFLYLQKIRFESAVITEISVDVKKLDYLVPPLAVQTVLENAFKHNKASVESPLCIRIYNENDCLIIVNNLQIKKTSASKGIGFSNLIKRYELLSKTLPSFLVTENEYIAKLPLIYPD